MLAKRLVYIIIFSFLVNLFWEVSHSLLYKTITDMSVYEYVPRILQASAGDIIMVAVIFLAISAFNKSLQWKINNKKNIILSIVLGLMLSIGFELFAIYTSRFEYNPSMPLIPILKVGLTPVLQMILTPLLTFWLAEKVNN